MDSGLDATNVSGEGSIPSGGTKEKVMTKKVEYYKQCRMERETARGVSVDVAWIPEKFAKVGKLVYLVDKPDDVYTVTAVGSRQDESYLKAKEKINRKFGASAGLNCD